jgi:predicted PurR-regulated permease PerM
VKGSRDSERLKRSFLLLTLAGVSVLLFLLARFFLVTLLVAAVSAGLFYPVHRRLWRRGSQSRTLTSLISTVLFVLIILVPVGVLGYFIVDNLIGIARTVSANRAAIHEWLQGLESALQKIPLLSSAQVSQLFNSDRLAQLLQQGGSFLLRRLTGVVENTARFVLLFFIYLYTLYFFIRDGGDMLRSVAEALPLPEEDQRAVTGRFLSVTRATLKSTFIIGGIQGTIGGVLYWILGIQGPVLWGVLIMIFAAIPGVGSIVVWLPTALVLLALGDYLKAVVLLAVGATIIPLVEGLLRPPLVGQDTRLHPVLVLVGVLGGIWVFGIAGLLVGPLIMSIGVTLWDIFKRMFGRELGGI